MEEWKTIDEAPNYEVSNKGRIKSKVSGKIRKTSETNLGYLQIGLRVNKKTIFRLVHRLVAKAFVNNEHNLPEVNHKDFNKLNNTAENLEWVDHRGNILHSWHYENPNKVTNEILRAVKTILNKYIIYEEL